MTAPARVRARDIAWLLVILAAALVVRLPLAGTRDYLHDEANTSIPLSRTISFEPGRLHLPLRAINHPALPAYFVKASSTLFGTTPLGYRAVHVILSLCTVTLVYLMASEWYGAGPARWAAALVAFNEYFVNISARATAHGPYLFFVAATVYAFSRFLRTQRPAWLYAAAGVLGLAFYCKEHSVFLLPALFLALLPANFRGWLRSPHPYLAFAVFALVIVPDAYWNATTNRETAQVPFREERVGYATYESHLRRIGGFGFSAYPFAFYARGPVGSLYTAATGREFDDNTQEYESMNPGLGVLLLAGVLAGTFAPARRDDLRRFLLLYFWIVFGFFMAISRGDSPGLDPVSWIWVDATMIPAAVATGVWLASLTGWRRTAAWAFAAAAFVYAGVWVARWF